MSVSSLLRNAVFACVAICGGSLTNAPWALDANTASVDELQAIRGIGPAMAARIVEAREREPFRDLEDLRQRVRGVGEKNLRRMHDAGLDVGGAGRIGNGEGRVGQRPAPSGARGAEGTRSAAKRVVRPPVEHYVGRPR